MLILTRKKMERLAFALQEDFTGEKDSVVMFTND